MSETPFTILANDSSRRIRLIPYQMDSGCWSYRVTHLGGSYLFDEPLFEPVSTREECERRIMEMYEAREWDLEIEN